MTLNVVVTKAESPQPESLNARRVDANDQLSNDYELNEGEWKTILIPVNDVAEAVSLTNVSGSGKGFVVGKIQFYKENEGVITNIKHTRSATRELSKREIYTLDGRCVGNDQRRLSPGLYIINGKKIVIK